MFHDVRSLIGAVIVLVLLVIILAAALVVRSLRKARRTLNEILIEEANRSRAQAGGRQSAADSE